MPWESKKQQRWGHSPAGKKELSKKEIKEFDDATDFDSLKEEATGGKGPTRRPGSGQKEPQSSKDAKRVSREIHKDMKQGGFHSSPKGSKGYNRKEKHKTDLTVGEELTPVDETYRGVGFPIAELNWKISARKGDGISSIDDQQYDEKYGDDDETPVIDTPGFPPTKEGGGNVPNKPAAWGALLAASLDWSTWKQQTFKDDGEKGNISAWGMKSIIDRGVQPHEKPAGEKRIGDAENQTQKRDIPSKKFKAYSMIGAFDW